MIKRFLATETAGRANAVTILSDSQATIKALASTYTHCASTLKAIHALNELGDACSITIRWIKAHAEHPGNELADDLAKQGARGPAVDLIIPGSKGELKFNINSYIYAKWQKKWDCLNSCRQTKIFFPKIDPGKSDKLMKQSRGMYSTLVQWITGHSFLNRHEFVIGNLDFNECRFCNLEPRYVFPRRGSTSTAHVGDGYHTSFRC